MGMAALFSQLPAPKFGSPRVRPRANMCREHEISAVEGKREKKFHELCDVKVGWLAVQRHLMSVLPGKGQRYDMIVCPSGTSPVDCHRHRVERRHGRAIISSQGRQKVV